MGHQEKGGVSFFSKRGRWEIKTGKKKAEKHFNNLL